MRLCDVRLRVTSNHHPQADGLSEKMNRVMGNYLRCYCALNQKDWDSLLASAESAFNSSKLDATGFTTVELDLGWNPIPPWIRSQENPKPTCLAQNVCDKLYRPRSLTQYLHIVWLRLGRDPIIHKHSALKMSMRRNFVWLFKSYFTDANYKRHVSKNLGTKRFGPFQVIESLRKMLFSKNCQTTPVPTMSFTSNMQSDSRTNLVTFCCPWSFCLAFKRAWWFSYRNWQNSSSSAQAERISFPGTFH